MPKGPNGQKRPADVIGNAVHVMRIATGEASEAMPASRHAVASKGGLARAAKLTKSKKSDIAKKAAKTRWKA